MAQKNGTKIDPPYHTPLFARLEPDKQARVLEAAKAEFAQNGFTRANINVIADRAGVSVGSMYKYFLSKEALFLELIELGYRQLESTLSRVVHPEEPTDAQVAALLRSAIDHASRDPQMVQIYIDCSTEELFAIAGQLSRNIESVGAGAYLRLLEIGRARGEVRDDIDLRMAAYFLDNIVLLVQFSYASEYYRERLRVFLDVDELPEADALVPRLTSLMMAGIATPID
jgi:AcrR family transcriptional regulator